MWSSTVLLDSPLPTGQGRHQQHNYLQAPHFLSYNSLKASLGSQRSMSLPDQQVLVMLMVCDEDGHPYHQRLADLAVSFVTELDGNDNILTQGVWSPQTSQLPRSQLFAFPRS